MNGNTSINKVHNSISFNSIRLRLLTLVDAPADLLKNLSRSELELCHRCPLRWILHCTEPVSGRRKKMKRAGAMHSLSFSLSLWFVVRSATSTAGAFFASHILLHVQHLWTSGVIKPYQMSFDGKTFGFITVQVVVGTASSIRATGRFAQPPLRAVTSLTAPLPFSPAPFTAGVHLTSKS